MGLIHLILKNSICNVISTMMVLLILVNSTNVSLMLKTLGDLMLAQKDIHHSIVNVHSTLLTVQVLGIVMISTILPKTLSGIMIPIMMDLSIGKITSTQNIMK